MTKLALLYDISTTCVAISAIGVTVYFAFAMGYLAVAMATFA